MATLASLNTLEGNTQAAIPYVRRAFEENMQDRWGSEALLFRTLLIWAIEQEQITAALEMAKAAQPKLFQEDPIINAGNVMQAIDVAYLLRAESFDDKAESLLKAVVEAYDQPYAVTEQYLTSGKAQALAMLGEEEAALKELRFQVENGWRFTWQLNTALSPAFEAVRQDPEYKEIMELLRSEIAAQLPVLRAMETSGEISPPLGGDRT